MKKINYALILLCIMACPTAFFAQTWTAQTSGSTANLKGVYFASDEKGWAVGSGGIILTTDDGGNTWLPQNSEISTQLNSVFFISPTTGWIATASSIILKTTDGGLNWSQQNTGASNVAYTDLFFLSETQGWSGGGLNICSYTTDGGNAWTNISSGFQNPTIITSLYFISTTEGWASAQGYNQGGAIYHTTNGGNTWSIQLTTGANLEGIYFTSANNGYAVGKALSSEGQYYWTSDGGQNWNKETLGTPAWFNDIHFPATENGWIVGNQGVIYSTNDEGNNWFQQSSNTTKNLNDCYFVNEGLGWAVGADGTILKFADPSVGINDIIINKNGLVLEQNFPNPFYSITKIKFEITQTTENQGQPVSLKVYDLSGKEIADLMNRELPPGTYEVDFEGSFLPGGIYFYKLKHGNFLSVKKMTLIK